MDKYLDKQAARAAFKYDGSSDMDILLDMDRVAKGDQDGIVITGRGGKQTRVRLGQWIVAGLGEYKVFEDAEFRSRFTPLAGEQG
jgi:hypothetical protein